MEILMGMSWSEAVETAVRLHVNAIPGATFTRQELIADKLDWIVNVTDSQGATPEMTLSRELQQLRDRGIIEFVDDKGGYKFI